MPVKPGLVKSTIMQSAPVNIVFYNGFRKQVHTLKRPFLVFLEAYPVDDVAHMLFSAGSSRGDIFFGKFIGVKNYLQNSILVCPYQEILPQTGIPFSGTPHDGQAVIFLLASGPGSCRALGNADAAAYAHMVPKAVFIIVYLVKNLETHTFSLVLAETDSSGNV